MISLRQQSLKPGFSLVELMAYMLIVGLLMTVVGVGVKKALDSAKESTTKSSLRGIAQAIDLYYSEVQPNRYPEQLDDLVVAPEGVRGWTSPYVKPIEVDGEKHVPLDGWKRDFVYNRTPGGPHPYELYSYGEGGEDAPQEKWIDAWSL